MNRKRKSGSVNTADIAFLPAVTPLEASVLPAAEKAAYGTLSMIPHAYDAGRENISVAQRAKIWVR